MPMTSIILSVLFNLHNGNQFPFNCHFSGVGVAAAGSAGRGDVLLRLKTTPALPPAGSVAAAQDRWRWKLNEAWAEPTHGSTAL